MAAKAQAARDFARREYSNVTAGRNWNQTTAREAFVTRTITRFCLTMTHNTTLYLTVTSLTAAYLTVTRARYNARDSSSTLRSILVAARRNNSQSTSCNRRNGVEPTI